jgi:hypothetical protein
MSLCRSRCRVTVGTVPLVPPFPVPVTGALSPEVCA